MLRKLIISSGILLLCFYASLASAARYENYQEKGAIGFWDVKGGIGVYSSSNELLNNPMIVNDSRPLVFNTLNQKTQKANPLFYLGLQKTFVLDMTALYSLSVGPSFYYQKINSSGVGMLPPSTDFPYNFDYAFNNTQFLFMLELQWTPVLLWNRFAPYLLIGAGANAQNLGFTVSNINPDNGDGTPRPDNVNKSQWGLAADLGLGAEILLTQDWGLDLRYLYLQSFNNHLSGISLNGPVSYQNASHNFMLSLIYRFGIQQE